MKNLTKILGVSSLMVVSAFAGDNYNILDNVYFPWKYSDVKVAGDCYQQPFELKKRYRVNQDNELEVFFGHGKLYRVKKDLSVNQKSFKEILENKGDSLMQRSRKLFMDIFEEVLESGNF